jgi:hypothetical protein
MVLAFCHVESITTSFFIFETSMSSMFFASCTPHRVERELGRRERREPETQSGRSYFGGIEEEHFVRVVVGQVGERVHRHQLGAQDLGML